MVLVPKLLNLLNTDIFKATKMTIKTKNFKTFSFTVNLKASFKRNKWY